MPFFGRGGQRRRRAGSWPTARCGTRGTAWAASLAGPWLLFPQRRDGLAERLAVGDESKALLDVVQRGLQAVVRRRGGGAVPHQHTVVAEEVRVHQRREHALVRVHAAEEQRGDPQVPQDAVELGVPEAAHAVLVDSHVARVLL